MIKSKTVQVDKYDQALQLIYRSVEDKYTLLGNLYDNIKYD